jgi:hypothetical protein
MTKLNIALTIASLFLFSSSAFADKIKVLDASYGLNCNKNLRGNMTSTVARACRNKARCNFTINHQIHGDPANGCAKDFVVDYMCKSKSKSVKKTAKIWAEASQNFVTLGCPK